MNQKGIFLLGQDIRELIEKAKLLSSSFTENNPISLSVSGKSGVTSQTFNRTFHFGIYQGNWLSISDWQGCRETLRNCIINAFDAQKPLGETRGLSLVCLAAINDPRYENVNPEAIVEFINNFFKDFLPTKPILAPGEVPYNGYQDLHLLTRASMIKDANYKTSTLRIVFPIIQNDYVTRHTTASILVNLLRSPEIYFDKKGNPLRKDTLIKSVAESLEKYHVKENFYPDSLGSHPDHDPMFLLWLLLARNVFPLFTSMSQTDSAVLTGPSRLMSFALSNKVSRQEIMHSIGANGSILSDFFNNFSDNMTRIFKNRSRGEGLFEVYEYLMTKYKKVIVEKVEVKPDSVESILAANKPTPRKRKVTNLQA